MPDDDHTWPKRHSSEIGHILKTDINVALDSNIEY
jgi:hypothetical protein